MNGRDEGRWKSKPPDGIVSASPNKMEEAPGRFPLQRQIRCVRQGSEELRRQSRREERGRREEMGNLKEGAESSIETRRR